MARGWRWLVVLLGAALLAALPWLSGAVHPRVGAVPASELLGRISASAATPYSGYATATGGLALPVRGRLDSVARLLRSTTRMRVWWRGDRDWRVDSISAAGEIGQHRSATSLWTWDFEDNLATADLGAPDQDPAARLPVAADLLPPNLGRRLLSGARTSEVTSLPSRWIAGHEAQGIRLRPSDRRTTISRVDVWADRRTAIPLRVEVAGAGSVTPTMAAELVDFSTEVPPASVTAFRPPSTARVSERVAPDLVALIARFGDASAPPTLVGLPRNASVAGTSAVAVYGRGVTELVAVPLWAGQAEALRHQLATAPGIARTPAGLVLSAGPLSLLLSGGDEDADAWLLTGTLTQRTMVAAALELRHAQGSL